MFQSVQMDRSILDSVPADFQPSVTQDSSHQTPATTSEASDDTSPVIDRQLSSQSSMERRDVANNVQNEVSSLRLSAHCQAPRSQQTREENLVHENYNNRATADQGVHTRRPNQRDPQNRADGYQRPVVQNHNQNPGRQLQNRGGVVDSAVLVGRSLRTVGDVFDREKRAVLNQAQQNHQAAVNHVAVNAQPGLFNIHQERPIHELVWNHVLAAADLLVRFYFILPR